MTHLPEPLFSPLLALVIALVLAKFANDGAGARLRALGISLILFSCLYHLCALHLPTAKILNGMNSPFIPIFILLVYPAVFLQKNKYYRFFLIIPALILISCPIVIWMQYDTIPAPERKFLWFLIPSGFLISSVISFFILMQPLLSLGKFRNLVRISSFIILMFGGFMFRQNYQDYKEMLSRRKNPTAGIANLSETSPVMSAKDNANYTYLPSAPCRFSADGGYIQGCNMEMAQRLMQLDFLKISKGEPTELQMISKVLGAFTFFIIFTFICARWFCGWICPLSFIGDILDRLRRLFGMPHVKPSGVLKLSYLFSGAGIASIGLAMAKCYPHLDENGRFMGCKIPLYPFCKICPGQQVCPVMSAGPAAYPSLPGWEWAWGFYKIGCVVMLVFFVGSFAFGRRLWCYFCPMGMISGIFNRGGLMTLRKNPLKCNHCGVCNEVCPMDIDVVRAEMKKTDVSSYNCTLCLKCVEKCPRNDCLSLEFCGKKITESKFK